MHGRLQNISHYVYTEHTFPAVLYIDGQFEIALVGIEYIKNKSFIRKSSQTALKVLFHFYYLSH